VTVKAQALPDDLRSAVEILWTYHSMGHDLHLCDVGIGLGSHDPGVAVIAVDLYRRGMYPWLVFTGANAPTTVDAFPRGEAVHYREYAIEHGVRADAVLVETKATNTQENLVFTRDLLARHGITVGSVLLMSRPYQQRRAYATCRKVWPEVDVLCASWPQSLDDYVATIGDLKKVIDMIVGDTQRVVEYASQGFAIRQDMPDAVHAAYLKLVEAGFTSRLLTTGE
jgi:uncharacterized SAM-binding protein YcdF (DUF218 family)